VAWERIWHIEPIPFDPDLVDRCEEAIREVAGDQPTGSVRARSTTRPRWPGPGVPTAMMFVQSLHGISHNKAEDTREEHLELCVRAFDRLADGAISWIAG
jgi:acetylornithine deacetylase/succinyl-diaminopimelate desuccinylase-like protein